MSATLTATTVRTGRWRTALSTGTPREDGCVPVYGALTVSPATRLSRLVFVPQEAVHRLRMNTPFLWTLSAAGEAVVVAVGAADVAALTDALTGQDGDAA